MENTLLLTIKRMGINGEGIGYYKSKAIFVPMTITGEIVEVKITEDLEKYAYGEVTKYKKMSEHRVKPRCEYYGRCGGCQMQHIDYNYQLEIKRDLVKEAFDKYFEGKFGNVEFRNIKDNIFYGII